MNRSQIIADRHAHFGRGLSLSYHQPLMIVRGEGQYLFDEQGRRYLDCVNNVCHLGHCHPRVVQAAAKQMATLNTNTRYLHPNLSNYVRELCDRFAHPLDVCYLTCSGSEAVDLALRMARTVTGRKNIIALEGAYHGNTQAAIDVSHYKFAGPGGAGRPSHTHCVAMPCGYRGKHRTTDYPDLEQADRQLGKVYAQEVVQCINEQVQAGNPPAAFIAESILGVGGQVMLPQGYLEEVYRGVRDAGGLCIADEVQVGFGRCGTHHWAYEMQGVTPDIVTLGKPIGNGHPMAAVITTQAISDAFDNGMEYFNTFGGNPVSCAVGQAVLEVIEDEGLQGHAREVGNKLLDMLEQLRHRHPMIGEVRGSGLFLGIELVANRETREPAAKCCSFIVEGMKDKGVLLSVDGPLHNVIKFKPPMVFSNADGEMLVSLLDQELTQCASLIE